MSKEAAEKLFNYAVAPSSQNWDTISAALDSQASSAALRLQAFEHPVRPELWNAISQVLDGQEEISSPFLMPVRSRFSRPFRMISAAAVLLLVAALITLYVNRSGTSDEVARQPAPTQEEQRPLSPDAPVEAAKTPDQTETQKSSSPRSPAPPTKGVSKPNRYVVMANEDGNKVRLSKKAFTVFDCAENSAPHNKERCKENIQLMQQKMAASMLSPAGDFGGLIDMIKSLEEND